MARNLTHCSWLAFEKKTTTAHYVSLGACLALPYDAKVTEKRFEQAADS